MPRFGPPSSQVPSQGVTTFLRKTLYAGDFDTAWHVGSIPGWDDKGLSLPKSWENHPILKEPVTHSYYHTFLGKALHTVGIRWSSRHPSVTAVFLVLIKHWHWIPHGSVYNFPIGSTSLSQSKVIRTQQNCLSRWWAPCPCRLSSRVHMTTSYSTVERIPGGIISGHFYSTTLSSLVTVCFCKDITSLDLGV